MGKHGAVAKWPQPVRLVRLMDPGFLHCIVSAAPAAPCD